jgi:hypothetical protein
MRKLKSYLKPIIEERLKMKKQYGEDWIDRPVRIVRSLLRLQVLIRSCRMTSFSGQLMPKSMHRSLSVPL